MTRHCCGPLVLVLLAAPLWGDGPEDKIKQLIAQRVEALTKARAASIANWKAGRADFTPIVIVERELLEARLQSAANDQDRIKVFEQQLGLARELEKAAQASIDSGRTNLLPLQLATAMRLNYEIQLARAKGKKD